MTTLALLLLLASPSAAKTAAPDFKLDPVLNAPVRRTSLAELKGKVVFLEFWATWCGPCVAGMPRTNRLIEKLAGEPVVFLAVTDEEPAKIETWLKTREVKSWIGVDTAGVSFAAYRSVGRPDGYLIGKDGALLARIFPDSLQEKDVRDAIAGTFKPKKWIKADASGAFSDRTKGRLVEDKPLFEAALTKVPETPEAGMSAGRDLIEGRSLPFVGVVAWIWDVERWQVLASTPVAGDWDFKLRAPGAFEEGRAALKAAVRAAAGVTIEPETSMTDVMLLRLIDGKEAPRPKPADGTMKTGINASGGGRLLGQETMARFSELLWTIPRKPVVDDTGLKGEYWLDLEWNSEDPAAAAAALASQGLVLVPGRRKVEFLRVSPAPKKN